MLQTWGQTEEGITLIKKNKNKNGMIVFLLTCESDIWPEIPTEQLLQH